MDTNSTLVPVDLRCERSREPFGIGFARPGLSWHFAPLPAPEPSARQAAFQVLAATALDGLIAGNADLWDSGRIESDETLNVTYAGRTVAPGERIWWTVRVWDAKGRSSPYAPPTWWETGLATGKDWAPARWIAPDCAQWPVPRPAPYLRRSFRLPALPLRARAYVCGLGYHEFYVNGARCGDAVLEPAQTDYDRYALYVTHDITGVLRRGDNAVGLILGNGWFNQDQVWPGAFEPYGQPGALVKLVIACADGSTHVIGSDSAWLAAPGPIVSNNVYAGETYDARLELPGWAEPGLPPGAWQPVCEVGPLAPELRAQLIPPIRRTQFLPAVARKQITCGTWVFDLGQNFAGWVRLRVTAPSGTRICLRFAEDVFADGSLNPLSTGVVHTRCVQTDRYFCRGDGPEVWEPRFTYHGFRYVEVSGIREEPPLELIEGVVVHTDFAPAGRFTCSDALLNRLHETARWTLRSNLHGLPTDCPARERCGWLGDAHTITEVTLLNYDSLTFWRKYHRDILHSRGRGHPAEPRVPANVAPGQRHCGQARPDWAVALVLIPWHLQVYADDRRLLQEAYPAMRELMDWLEENARDHIVADGFGDWCPPGSVEPVECPPALTSTAFYFLCTTAMTRSAQVLGETADAQRYAALGTAVRGAFCKKFFRKRGHTFGSQTANAVALAFGLVPEETQAKVASALARHVTKNHHGHFYAGIHGLRHLFDMLCTYKLEATAWRALQATGFPGFKQHFSLGATTFWEVFYHPWMHMMHDRSLNHPMQAAFAAWFFHGVGGIRPDPAAPGFKHFTLCPHLWRKLTRAEATYESARGSISSHWERIGRRFTWHITVPANTTATVTLPCRSVTSAQLNGQNVPAGSAVAGGFLQVPLGPGRHVLKSTLPSCTECRWPCVPGAAD